MQENIIYSKEKDFDKWYQDLLIKCDLIEYYDISGLYVLKHEPVSIWENVKEYLNKEFNKMEVKNVYFPLFVRKENLEKESTHIAGFTPEVAWIKTKDNNNEDIAIRPTSETIIYPYAKKWFRSYKDLPVRVNQWCNVVRWEFSDPTPFIRSREFLWQEGHTFHETKESAGEEVLDILKIYQDFYEKVMLVPVIPGTKTESEKFCGADYTTTLETYIPECGRGIQCCTSHCLGQNFSKIFDLRYTDSNNSDSNYVWQNSWGLSTRSIGVMLMVHSDNKGLVLPPKLASTQIVVVTKEDNIENKDEFEKFISLISSKLDKYRVYFDRSNETIGRKFNKWEKLGVPLRVEIGKKEFESNTISIFRRDEMKRIQITNIDSLDIYVDTLMTNIEENMYKKAKDKLMKHVINNNDWEDFIKNIKNNAVLVPWCGNNDCEKDMCNTIKQSQNFSIKTLCIPFEMQNVENKKCIKCKNDAAKNVIFGRSF
jgi:prolyl-tRNA synthetase